MVKAIFDRVRIAKAGLLAIVEGLIGGLNKAANGAVGAACAFAQGAVTTVTDALLEGLKVVSGAADDAIDIAEAAAAAAAGVLTGKSE